VAGGNPQAGAALKLALRGSQQTHQPAPVGVGNAELGCQKGLTGLVECVSGFVSVHEQTLKSSAATHNQSRQRRQLRTE
jgi:hypothetical protein